MGNKRNVRKAKHHPYQRPPVPETNHEPSVLETRPEPMLDRPPDLYVKREVCANCKVYFRNKNGGKGYYRFCVDTNLSTGQLARELLDQLLGVKTPFGDVFGRFLCPECWRLMNNISKYNECVKQFFEATKPLSYVAKNSTRKHERSLIQALNGCNPGPAIATPLYWPEDHSYHKDPNPKPPKQPASKKGKKVTKDDPKKSFKLRFPRQKRPEPYSQWGTIICAIRARHYRRAISGLYQATRATKRHFAGVAARIVRKETRQLLEKHHHLCQNLSVSAINEFSWDTAVDSFAEHAPLLFSVIRGVVTNKHNEKTMNRGPRINLKPIIGTALGILLHARAPQLAKFLPSYFSLHFGRGKLRRETINQLYRLGLCHGYESSMRIADTIPSSVDSAALRLKASVEKEQESTMTASPENCDEEAEGGDLSPENCDDDDDDEDLPPENCDDSEGEDLNPDDSEDDSDDEKEQDNCEDAEGDDLCPENCDDAEDDDLNSENPEDTLDDDLKQENFEDAESDDPSPESCDDDQDGDQNPENFEDAEEGTLNLECFEVDEDVDSGW